MKTELFNLFCDVAQRGSFAAAAESKDIDPSSVSRAIRQLEEELGARLFHRTTRKIELTEAGTHLLTRVSPLVEELAQISEEVVALNNQPKGHLRLTSSVTFGQTMLTPLLKRFQGTFPDISLECMFTDKNLDLVADRIDLAIRLAPSLEGDVIATKLMPTKYHVVASLEYLDQAIPLQTPSDLSAHNCIMFPFSAYRRTWQFLGKNQQMIEVPIKGRLTLSPANAILDAAKFSCGPALLPNWLVDNAIESGALVDCFPDYQVTATTFDTAVWLAYPSRTYLPNKVRVLIDFLKEWIS